MDLKNKKSFLQVFLILSLVFAQGYILLNAESTSDIEHTEVMSDIATNVDDNTQVHQQVVEERNVEFVASDFDPSEWQLDTTNTSAYVLRAYTGSKTDIYIPGKHTDGKQVIIDSLRGLPGVEISPLLYSVSNTVENIKIEAVDGVKVSVLDNDAQYGFAHLGMLKTVDLRGLDVSNITDMRGFFYLNSNLITLNVSNFNTSNVEYMQQMFYADTKLTTLDLSSFDTSNTINMQLMFSFTESLAALDISNFDTSNVTDMYGMFSFTESLTALDISKFDTSNVTDMVAMFGGAKSLITLDLSNFDTSNVTNMSSMFSSTDELNELDISNFDTSNVTGFDGMFGFTPKLEILDLSSFNLSGSSNINSMFYSGLPQERLIISTDQKLVNYDYQGDNNIPLKITTLDANDGKFLDGTAKKEYVLPSVVAATMPTVSQEYDEFLQQIPVKEPETFVGWDNKLPSFPASILSMRNTTFNATWKILPKLAINPQIVELELNDPEWGRTISAKDGVDWSDNIDTNDIFQPITIVMPTAYQDDSTTVVDIHKSGVYHVNYVLTNSSGGTVSGTRIYVVGAKSVGAEYALFANDFDRKLSDAIHDSDEQIIQNADAQAILLADGIIRGTVELTSKTGYATTIGNYPVTFSVREEDTLHTTVTSHIYDEIKPTLPITGEQTMELNMIALVLIFISLLGLFTIKPKRTN